jgi:hypothetical protein
MSASRAPALGGSWPQRAARPHSDRPGAFVGTSYKTSSDQLSLDITAARGPASGKDDDARAAHLLHNTQARRFWKKVTKLNGNNACWVWTSSLNDGGYGQFWVGAVKRNLLAHRLAYVLTYGPIARGLLVCHRCDNPICVRPEHLFVGTVADNLRDMVRKGRHPEQRIKRGVA